MTLPISDCPGSATGRHAIVSPPPRTMTIVAFLVILAAALASILPNYHLFSTDDLATSLNPEAMHSMAMLQASNGRFVFFVVASLLSAAHVDYPTFQALGGAVFIASLLFLFFEIARFLDIRSDEARLFAGVIFFTSCFSIDLYQFRETYLCFGLSFLCSALAIRCAALPVGLAARVALATLFAVLAFGTYQTAPQILVMVAGLGLIARLLDSRASRSMRDIVVLIAATLIATIAYFAITKILVANVEGFTRSTARLFGPQFVLANLGAYLRTVTELTLPVGNAFDPITNHVLSAALAMLWIGAAIGFSVATRGWRKIAIWVVLAGLLICAPNPANLLLKDFWPTPRSAQGIVIFFAGMAALLVQLAVDRGFRYLDPRRALGVLLGLLILMQVVNNSQLLSRRTMQQDLDFALARQIVTDIERLAPPTSDSIPANIVAYWSSNALFQRMPYSVGLGLFGSDWSARALLTFVSRGRVIARSGNPADCPPAPLRTVPATVMGRDGVPLVCFPSAPNFWSRAY